MNESYTSGNRELHTNEDQLDTESGRLGSPWGPIHPNSSLETHNKSFSGFDINPPHSANSHHQYQQPTLNFMSRVALSKFRKITPYSKRDGGTNLINSMTLTNRPPSSHMYEEEFKLNNSRTRIGTTLLGGVAYPSYNLGSNRGNHHTSFGGWSSATNRTQINNLRDVPNAPFLISYKHTNRKATPRQLTDIYIFKNLVIIYIYIYII